MLTTLGNPARLNPKRYTGFPSPHLLPELISLQRWYSNCFTSHVLHVPHSATAHWGLPATVHCGSQPLPSVDCRPLPSVKGSHCPLWTGLWWVRLRYSRNDATPGLGWPLITLHFHYLSRALSLQRASPGHCGKAVHSAMSEKAGWKLSQDTTLCYHLQLHDRPTTKIPLSLGKGEWTQTKRYNTVTLCHWGLKLFVTQW